MASSGKRATSRSRAALARPGEDPEVQRPARVLEQRVHERGQLPAGARGQGDGDVERVRAGRAGVHRRRDGAVGGRGVGRVGRGQRGRPRAPRFGGEHVVRGEIAPQPVHVVLGRAGEDRRVHALEPLEHPVADRGERGVVDVHQPVEADVRAVVRAELDVHPDRAHRQVAVQPRRHHAPVLRPVGLQQRERVADVAHERAPPHGRVGVLVDGRRPAGRPRAGCRRRRAARPPALRDHRGRPCRSSS